MARYAWAICLLKEDRFEGVVGGLGHLASYDSREHARVRARVFRTTGKRRFDYRACKIDTRDGIAVWIDGRGR